MRICLLLLMLSSLSLVSCSDDKKKDKPSAVNPDWERWEQVYESWQENKVGTYSYSWVLASFETEQATVINVDVVDGKPVCRSKSVGAVVEWSEDVDTINTHEDATRAITLQANYDRCWELYETNKNEIHLFFKSGYLAGCHLGCKDNSCKDEDKPFFKLSVTKPLCNEASF